MRYIAGFFIGGIVAALSIRYIVESEAPRESAPALPVEDSPGLPLIQYEAEPEKPAESDNVIEETVKSIGKLVNDAFAGIVSALPGVGIFRQADGDIEERRGPRNWRNNNPGNIEYGNFAKANGAIGSDGRFAVFATVEAGYAAMEKLLFESRSYSGLTLTQAIARWAPPSENNTALYQKTVLAAIGGIDIPMRDYAPTQRQAIMAAMARHEGFRVGQTAVKPAQT